MGEQTRETWVEAAQSELFYGWARWASFACIWAWTCLSLLLVTGNADSLGLPEILALPH